MRRFASFSAYKSLKCRANYPYGTKWSNVYIENYKRNHDAHKSNSVTVEFYLVGYNSVGTDVSTPFGELLVLGEPITILGEALAV